MNYTLQFNCLSIILMFIITSCANKSEELRNKIESSGLPVFNILYETGDDGKYYSSLKIEKKGEDYSALEITTCNWDSTVNDTLLNSKLNSKQIEYCKNFILYLSSMENNCPKETSLTIQTTLAVDNSIYIINGDCNYGIYSYKALKTALFNYSKNQY